MGDSRLGIQCATLFFVGLLSSPSFGDIAPETVSQTTLPEPSSTWFVAKNVMGAGFVFDAASAQMLGTLSLTPFTPTITRSELRNEIYAAEAYYSRRYRGKREDVLTIYDHANLAPIHEIDIPDKIASLNFLEYLSLLGDERFLTVFNMTPAQSVSVVDLQERRFVSEISTPGCALTMSAGERGFLMICGDGTLQLIQLDADGAEAERVRSKSFFSVDKDPVFDQPVRTNDGWQLISFEGKVFEVTLDAKRIRISKPWSVLTDEDKAEQWRVGGGQIMDVHRGLDLLYVLMHQGGVDTHEDPGTEVWVFSRATNSRIARLPLEKPTRSILVTQNESPLVIGSAAIEPNVQVYNGLTLKSESSIEVGAVVGSLRAY